MDSPYYLSKSIARQLDNSKKVVIEADQDRIFLITGGEGSGKSKLAQQLAYHLDNNFCLDDIVFNSTTFVNKVRTQKKFKCVVFDEAFNGLSSRGALSKENKKVIGLLQECRQRNLFIFIVLPSIFLLEKYVGLFRSHCLFHTAIYKKDFKKRFYKVYTKNKKKLLYILGKKLMSYYQPKINKKHRFYSNTPPTIDEKAYKKKKLHAFRDDEKVKTHDIKDKKPLMLEQLRNREKNPELKKKISQRTYAMLSGVSQSTIGAYLKEITQEIQENEQKR